jgi:hypothetical protein
MRDGRNLSVPVVRGILVVVMALLAVWLFMLVATPAQAAELPATAQESPYQAPDLIQVDLPSWAEPLEPLAALPLWAQAALASAFVGGLFYLVPAIGRWVTTRFEGEGVE